MNAKMNVGMKSVWVSGVWCFAFFVCCFVLSGMFTPSNAQDLNQIKLRGHAFRVSHETHFLYPGEVYEAKVFLNEVGAGFSQVAWFACPTGSCLNPANLLACKCRYDRTDPNSETYSCHPEIVSGYYTENGQVQHWECPDPGKKNGNCLGMTGFVNFEGGEQMRPFMTSLGILPQSSCTAK